MSMTSSRTVALLTVFALASGMLIPDSVVRGDPPPSGPLYEIYGGQSTIHNFSGLSDATGPVIVSITCVADLGCTDWDATDCNDCYPEPPPGCTNPPYCGSSTPSAVCPSCEVHPYDKYLTVQVGRPGTGNDPIRGTDPYVGVPDECASYPGFSCPPVPSSGHFFATYYSDTE